MPRFIAIFDSLPAHLPLLEQLSPRIAVFSPRALLLEIPVRSQQSLFERLRREASPALERVALAWSGIAATLAARARPGSVVPAGEEERFLGPLPLTTLEVVPGEGYQEILCRLTQWGLTTLGEFSRLSPHSLAARLGSEAVRLQRLARGRDAGPYPLLRPKTRIVESRELEWPCSSLEPLTFLLRDLLERLCRRLEMEGLAAGEIELILKLEHATAHHCSLRPALPLCEARTLLSLLRLELQRNSPRGAVVEVRIEVDPVRPRRVQHSLLHPPQPAPEKFSRTLGRLEGIVGKERIGSPLLLDTHRPDAVRMRPFRMASRPSGHPPQAKRVSLTLRRIRPPQKIYLRPEQIVAAAGPWPVSGGWWGEDPWSREEWDVELTRGPLCRIFWDRRAKGWFLEGVYD